ncbi:MAG: preprotein translocase subunit SecG [Deltaproteobacteria bacterium]|nr:preprotein translocase subunit SecG [Deltaproteobacteria bacterium]
MYSVLIVLHVIVCLFLILVVLLQAGKGGGMGIGFGSTSSQSVFGGSGAGNFLSRATGVFATVFILNSLALAYLSSRQDAPRLRELAEQQVQKKKAEDATKQKMLGDVDKARAAIEKATGTPTSSEPAAATPEGTVAPTTDETAPAAVPADPASPVTAPATAAPTPAPAAAPAEAPATP